MLLGAVTALSALIALGVGVGTQAFGSLAWLWVLPLSFVGSFLGLVLIGFLFVLYLCRRVDQSVPQQEEDRFYRAVVNLLIESAAIFFRIRVKTTGLEKIPEEGRFLLIANHTDDSDGVIITRVLPDKQLAFVSKQENSSMFVVGPMMHKLLFQLINRENDREALRTIVRCIQILKEDKASIAVFPEGGIDDDGLLHRFRPGVFKIAKKAGVPIVVTTLKNTPAVIPNMLRLKPTCVEFHILETIPVEEVKAFSTVELARRCHDLMAADLGPELVAED